MHWILPVDLRAVEACEFYLCMACNVRAPLPMVGTFARSSQLHSTRSTAVVCVCESRVSQVGTAIVVVTSVVPIRESVTKATRNSANGVVANG